MAWVRVGGWYPIPCVLFLHPHTVCSQGRWTLISILFFSPWGIFVSGQKCNKNTIYKWGGQCRREGSWVKSPLCCWVHKLERLRDRLSFFLPGWVFFTRLSFFYQVELFYNFDLFYRVELFWPGWAFFPGWARERKLGAAQQAPTHCLARLSRPQALPSVCEQ